MKIKALDSIIEFDGGNMVVINEGEEGELSDAKALSYIAAGKAEEAKAEAVTETAATPKKGKTVKAAEEVPADESPLDEAPAE